MRQRLDRTSSVLAAILIPLILGTIIGLVALWPTGDLPETGIVSVEAEYPTARVLDRKSVV